jgi:anti-sigma regulatory factor (Ser/Thr protein kinase)
VGDAASSARQRSLSDRSVVNDFGFAADHRAATVARDAFATWLGEWCEDDELVEDLRTVFGELAANAVEATPDGSSDDISAVAWCEGNDLVLEVTNAAPPPGRRVDHWDMDDPLRPGGRGLMIARAFTDSLEVDSDGGSIIVRCFRRVVTG